MDRQQVNVAMSDIALSKRMVYEAMGYGSASPDDLTCQITDELLEKAMVITHPKFYYQLMPCNAEDTNITVAHLDFHTEKTITTLLQGSQNLALFVATVGGQFQQWLDDVKAQGDILRLFVLDSIGTSIVESVGDLMEQRLQEAIGELNHTNRFSPGYCGWDILEQHKLFSLLPTRVCGIDLSDSSLMHPIKSISGVIGVGKDVQRKKYGCAICDNKNCYRRKK